MKLTDDQIAFAERMTVRQADTLRALAYAGHSFALSASERGDPEMYALIRARLAQCDCVHVGRFEYWTWHVTRAGRQIADRFLRPALCLAP